MLMVNWGPSTKPLLQGGQYFSTALPMIFSFGKNLSTRALQKTWKPTIQWRCATKGKPTSEPYSYLSLTYPQICESRL